MTKKRVTIYIDGDLWESVKSEARKRSVSVGRDISASVFIEDSIRAFLTILPTSNRVAKEKVAEPSSDNGGKFFNPRPKK